MKIGDSAIEIGHQTFQLMAFVMGMEIRMKMNAIEYKGKE